MFDDENHNFTKAELLNLSIRDFRNPHGNNIVERTRKYDAWVQQRINRKIFPYDRTMHKNPQNITEIVDRNNQNIKGINLASQDYLGLSSTEEIKEAVIKGIKDFGVHSAGTAMLVGNTTISRKLEEKIADFIHYNHVLLFPTGWEQGLG